MTDFSYILESFGEDAAIFDAAGSHAEKVFIMPATMRWTSEIKELPTETGIYDTGRYLCFIRGDFDFKGCGESYLVYGGGEYEFLNAELFKVEKSRSHWECVIRRRGELYIDGD